MKESTPAYLCAASAAMPSSISKKLQKDGLSEDVAKDAEKDIQALTDKYIAFIEKHLAAKEKEIMAV